MRKKFLTLFFVYFSLIAVAQSVPENTITFLGIPIDGSEQEMIAQLKQKGFKENRTRDGLIGQFNGQSVELYVTTNHQKVDRVYVAFPYCTERKIRFEYNNLLNQFKKNNKYSGIFSKNEEIPLGEDIGYEMKVNNKDYSAHFHYINPDIGYDEIAFKELFYKVVSFLMSENDIEEFHSRYMDALGQDKALVYVNFMAQVNEKLGTKIEKIEKEELPLQEIHEIHEILGKIGTLTQQSLSIIDSMRKGRVWFTIHENYGKYFIGLYYDNLANRPNGEDL